MSGEIARQMAVPVRFIREAGEADDAAHAVVRLVPLLCLGEAVG